MIECVMKATANKNSINDTILMAATVAAVAATTTTTKISKINEKENEWNYFVAPDHDDKKKISAT